MSQSSIIWLASYPRSGNTMLRTILWNCFGLKSASIYPKDLGGNQDLENYVGHIEKSSNGSITFPPNSLPLIKTHEKPLDNNPAIYVVRDGRAASISLWNFYQQQLPLTDIISGNHRFGTWSNHCENWSPQNRPNTLLIKYETMVSDLSAVLNSISEFLNREIKSNCIPDRNSIAKIDGKWVKKKGDWEEFFTAEISSLFDRLNYRSMVEMQYSSKVDS